MIYKICLLHDSVRNIKRNKLVKMSLIILNIFCDILVMLPFGLNPILRRGNSLGKTLRKLDYVDSNATILCYFVHFVVVAT